MPLESSCHRVLFQNSISFPNGSVQTKLPDCIHSWCLFLKRVMWQEQTISENCKEKDSQRPVLNFHDFLSPRLFAVHLCPCRLLQTYLSPTTALHIPHMPRQVFFFGGGGESKTTQLIFLAAWSSGLSVHESCTGFLCSTWSEQSAPINYQQHPAQKVEGLESLSPAQLHK